MTPEQKTALVAACESGDDVRIVTIALQIAAHLARNKRQDEAIVIRNEVDRIQAEAHRELEYKKLRLSIATAIFAGDIQCSETRAILSAGNLIAENENLGIPGRAIKP